MNLALLKKLSEAPGVPGREERVRDILSDEFKNLFDEVTTDPLGSLIGRKRAGSAGSAGAGAGGAKKVIIAAHIDEIGFYVKHVSDKGFIRVHNVGGFDMRNLFARRVRVQTAGGEDLIGLMNPEGRPIHLAREEDRKKVP